MSESDRQSELLDFLSIQVGLVSTRQLAHRFGVSVSTIERDLKCMTAAGHSFYSQTGRSGGLRLEKNDTHSAAILDSENLTDPFVGRNAELAKLRAVADAATAGIGKFALIAGKSGIGKTRLVEEFGKTMGPSGARMLWGRSVHNFATPSFWPWIQVIKSSAEGMSSELIADADELVNALMGTDEALPELSNSSADAVRFKLYHRTATYLCRAEMGPQVIVLDDLQWADSSSLNFIEFLFSAIGNSPILLLGVYDNTGVKRNSRLSRLVGSISRSSNFTRIHLGPMSATDAMSMIATQSQSKLPDELSDRISERAEGNPFFIKELVQHVTERSARDVNDYRSQRSFEEIPDGIREAVGRRLDDLSEPCLNLLELASLLGREFSANAIEAVTDSGQLRLSDTLVLLDEAIAGGLIAPSEAANEYRFVHTLVRDTVDDEISLTRRAQLHSIIGENLESLYGSDADKHPEELARHFLAAVPVSGTDKAIKYSFMAGDRAMARFSYEDAARQYENILSLRSDSIAEDDRIRSKGKLGQAMTRFATRDEKPEAVKLLTEAVEYYISTERIDHALEYALTDVMPNAPGGQDQTDICGMIEKVINRVTAYSREHALLLARYGFAVVSERLDRDTALRVATEAANIGERLEDPHVTLLADKAIMSVKFRTPEYRASFIDDCERLLRNALRMEDMETELRARWYMTSSLMSSGDLQKADQVASEFLERADRYRDANNLQQALGMNANLAVRFGDWDRARSLTKQNSEKFGGGAWAEGASYYMDSALGGSDEISRLIKFVSDGSASRRNERIAVAILLICNRPDVVDEDLWKSSEELLEITSFKTLNSQTKTAEAILSGVVSAHSGDSETAAIYYEKLSATEIPILQLNGAHPQRHLAKICALRGDPATASSHLRASIDYCQRNRSLPELALSLTEFADAAVLIGLEEAVIRNSLERAGQIAVDLEMKALGKRIAQMSSELQERIVKFDGPPAGLSERELEVLLLIAEGSTNRLIGERLFISENTVTRHITNIFEKIGVGNRAEATAYVYRNRLIAP